MDEPTHTLALLREELATWEALLANASTADLEAARPPDGMSVKAVLGHLHAWQQVSIARLAAAHDGGAPVLPAWLAGGHPEAEERREEYNARIAAMFRDQSAPAVVHAWRVGFQRFLELAAAVPDDAMLSVGRYPWIAGYALIAVLQGSYGHHHEEHLAEVRAWLGG